MEYLETKALEAVLDEDESELDRLLTEMSRPELVTFCGQVEELLEAIKDKMLLKVWEPNGTKEKRAEWQPRQRVLGMLTGVAERLGVRRTMPQQES